jgi:hypothetical protein
LLSVRSFACPAETPAIWAACGCENALRLTHGGRLDPPDAGQLLGVGDEAYYLHKPPGDVGRHGSGNVVKAKKPSACNVVRRLGVGLTADRRLADSRVRLL